MRPTPLSITLLVFLGCGASTAPPARPATLTVAPAVPAHVDAAESSDPIRLAPLFGPETKESLPQSVGDLACLGGCSSSGDHAKDFDALVASCGAPTGMREYVKPVSGELHYRYDQRDTYVLKLLGGYCYRFFAVGDRGIANLDLHVARATPSDAGAGAMASVPVVVSSDAPWCEAQDGDYLVELVAGPPGFGGYTFAVWARPKI
jgi:hypothetical protein